MKRIILFLVILLIGIVQPLVVHAYSQADIESVITRTEYYDPSDDACGDGATSLTGDDNKAKIFNYLIGKEVAGVPLKDFHVAGIMGNMQNESAFEPQRLEGTPSGTITTAEEAANSSDGWGLVQWTPASKMISPTKAAGKDANEIAVQLDFLLEQLNGGTPSQEKAAGEALAAATTIEEATIAFEAEYERHKPPLQPSRIVNAQNILAGAAASAGIGAAGDAVTGEAPADTGGGSDNKPVIVLDPGHGGTDIDRVDSATGLHDGDFPNHPEMEHAFAVAQIAKTKLEADGYKVIMTKNAVNDSVFLRDRANIANNANADLAVSIHTTGDKQFGQWQEIYVQKDGLYRGSGANKTVFSNGPIAAASQRFATIMKGERDAIEGGQTVIKDNSFDGRTGGIEPGNIPLVQLFATVPWIYLEAGGNGSAGLTDAQKNTYAQAIVSGIEKAIPSEGAGGEDECSDNTAGNGDVVATALKYAWPEYHAKPYTNMKPEYATAIAAAKAAGQYIGGITDPGVDCGGFVTRVMIDSGFEPRYNYNGKLSDGAGPTGTQKKWLDENWENLGPGSSTLKLQPGDVAMGPGHTYMFVGQQPGFETQIASASLDGRAPMAGKESLTSSEFTWYRKKASQ